MIAVARVAGMNGPAPCPGRLSKGRSAQEWTPASGEYPDSFEDLDRGEASQGESTPESRSGACEHYHFEFRNNRSFSESPNFFP